MVNCIARVIACLILIGCARESVVVVEQSSELVPFILEFEEVAKGYGKEIRVDKSVILETNWDGSGFVGFCYGNGLVKIKKEYWDLASYEERYWLMFHELGHCYLKREHLNDLIDTGDYLCPISIMNAGVVNLYCIDYFILNKTLFLDELFL